MNDIENKVVEMKFDNEQFEAAVSKTMSTLDRFKEKLNFEGAGKGLDKLGKSTDQVSYGMTDLYNRVDAIGNHLESLETIGGMALMRLKEKALDLAQNGIGRLFDNIVKNGMSRAMNLEQAKFQMQGILGDAKKVNQMIYDWILPELQGTPFSLDQAAVVIGQIAASSRQSEHDIRTATRGIAGLAAMTNHSFADVGRIFTKVAGQGTIMAEELNQLSGYGVNAAADLSRYFQSVVDGSQEASDAVKEDIASIIDEFGEISEGVMREAASKRLIHYDAMAEAMDALYGEHASKSTTMYTGALEDLRAAFGRLGAEAAAVRLETLRDAFNALVPAVDAVAAVINPLISATHKINEETGEYVKEFKGPVAQTVKELGWAFQELFVQLDEQHDIKRFDADAIHSLNKRIYAVRKDVELTDNQIKVLKLLGIQYDETNKKLANGTKLTSEQAKTLNKFNFNLPLAVAGYEQFGVKLIEYNRTLKTGAKITKDQARAIRDMGIEIEIADGKLVKSSNFTRDQALQLEKMGFQIKRVRTATDAWMTEWGQDVSSGSAVMNPEMWRIITGSTQSLVNVMRVLTNFTIPIAQGFREVFGFVTLEGVANIVEKIRDLTSYLTLSEKSMARLKEISKALFSPLGLVVRTAVSGLKLLLSGLEVFIKVMKPVGAAVLSAVAAFAQMVSNIGKFIIEVTGGAQALSSFIFGIVQAITRFLHLDKLIENIRIGLEKLADIFDWIGYHAGEAIGNLYSKFKNLGKFLADAFHLADIVAKLKEAFAGLKPALEEAFHISELAQTFSDAFEKIKNTIKDYGIINAFVDSLKGIVEFLGDIVPYESIISGLSKALEGLLGSIKNFTSGPINKFIGFIGDIVGDFVESFKTIGATKYVNDLIKKWIKPYGFIKNIQSNIEKYVIPTFKTLKELILDFLGFGSVKALLSNIVGKIQEFGKAFEHIKNVEPSKIAEKIKEKLTSLFSPKMLEALQKFLIVFKIFRKYTNKGFAAFAESLSIFFKSMDGKKAKAFLTTLAYFAIAYKYVRTIQKLFKTFDAIGSMFKSIGGAFSKIGKGFDNVFKAFSGLAKWMKRAVMLISLSASLLIFAAALYIISKIDTDKILVGGAVLVGAIVAFAIALKMLDKITITEGSEKKILMLGATVAAMSLGLFVMAEAVKKVSEIYDKDDPAKLLISVTAVVAMFMAIIALVKNLENKEGSGQLVKAAGGMVALGSGLKIVAEACKMFADIPKKDLIKGMASIVVAIAAFSLFAAAANKWKEGKPAKIFSAALGMLALSAALLIIYKAVALLGAMDINQLSQGALTVMVMIGMLSVFASTAGKANSSISKASGAMLLLGASIMIMAKAIELIGNLPDDVFAKGVGVFAGIVALFIAIASMSDTADYKLGLSLGAVGAGILAIAVAISVLGSLNILQLGKGLIFAAAGLVALVAALALINHLNLANTKVAGTLVAMAGAMFVFATVIAFLAVLPFESLVAGLLGMLAILIVVGTTLAVLGTIMGPELFAVSAAFALLGVAVLFLAAGVVLLAVGLAALVPLLMALSVVDTETLGAGLDVIKQVAEGLSIAFATLASGLAVLGLAFIVAGAGALLLAAGIIALSVAFIIASIGLIALGGGIAAFVSILEYVFGTGIVEGIRNAFEYLGQTIMQGLGGLFEKVKNFFTRDRGIETTREYGAGLTEGTKQGAESSYNETKESIEKPAKDALLEMDGLDSYGTGEGIMQRLTAGVGLGEGGLNSEFSSIMDGSLQTIDGYAPNMELEGIDMTSWLGDGVDKGSPEVMKYFDSIGSGGSDVLEMYKGQYNAAGQKNTSGYASGIESKKKLAQNAAGRVANAAKTEAGNYTLYSEGANAGQGFIDGLGSMIGGAIRKAAELVRKAKQGAAEEEDAHSPSREFAKLGVYAGEGYILGMQSMAKKVAMASAGMAGGAIDAMSEAISAAADIANSDLDFTPTIMPVVDLSNVKNGIAGINGMFADSPFNIKGNANLSALSGTVVSRNQNDYKMVEAIDAMSSRIESMERAINNPENTNHTFNFNIPLDVNGRELARAQVTYNQSELDRAQMLENRKLGIV